MDLNRLSAVELKKLIADKKASVEEVTRAHLEHIEKVDNKLGAFLYTAKEEALKQARDLDEKLSSGKELGLLGGVPVAIKDNISVQGMQNTCASKILQNYIAPYDAKVIENIKNADGIILGKLNMDEFAMGSSNENSAYKLAINPWDISRVPGGSSGGAAVSVASGEAPLSLGTETGGSVRQPASLCGVVGLKPTYGRISRYGVVAFGSTLDQVGPMARTVEDCALITEVIAGEDHRDYTSSKEIVPNYKDSLKKSLKGVKVGVPKEFFGEGLDPKVGAVVQNAIEEFKRQGAELVSISLPLSDYSLSVYYIMASAEASSNLARFDGVRYGKRAEEFKNSVDLYYASRSEGFGSEVKRRIMLGTYVLSAGYYDAYYKKALKVRNLIKQDFDRVFKEVDVIVSPTSPTTAFKIGERTSDVLSMYMSDIYTVPVNIAGIPAISVPCGKVEGLPVGLQLMGNYFREDMLFNMGYNYEQATGWYKEAPVL